MKKAKFITLLIMVPFLMAFNSGEEKSGSNEGTKSPDKKIIAQVIRIFKDVTKKTSEEPEWVIAKKGDPLEDGGEVKTGFKSLAIVVFTDGSGTLRVRENSILHIYGEQHGKSMNKNTFIQKGLIGFDVNKQAADEEFKFTTPTVVASIRGTNGFLEYGEDSTFTMSLDAGFASLQFSGSGGCDSLSAGGTVVINSNGQCNNRRQNDDDKNKSNMAQGSDIKKIFIKTNKGDVEIQYYAPKN